jgi:hypothetical protein
MAGFGFPFGFHPDFHGGAITRYISFEGTMHIREGETSNEIVTDKHFFKIKIEEKGEQQNYHDVPYLMSPLHHDFKATYDFLGKENRCKNLDYIQRKKTAWLLTKLEKNICIWFQPVIWADVRISIWQKVRFRTSTGLW